MKSSLQTCGAANMSPCPRCRNIDAKITQTTDLIFWKLAMTNTVWSKAQEIDVMRWGTAVLEIQIRKYKSMLWLVGGKKKHMNSCCKRVCHICIKMHAFVYVCNVLLKVPSCLSTNGGFSVPVLGGDIIILFVFRFWRCCPNGIKMDSISANAVFTTAVNRKTDEEHLRQAHTEGIPGNGFRRVAFKGTVAGLPQAIG